MALVLNISLFSSSAYALCYRLYILCLFLSTVSWLDGPLFHFVFTPTVIGHDVYEFFWVDCRISESWHTYVKVSSRGVRGVEIIARGWAITGFVAISFECKWMKEERGHVGQESDLYCIALGAWFENGWMGCMGRMDGWLYPILNASVGGESTFII